jgi:hypothetical protein
MQWFRLYNEVADDAKVQRLPADLLKAWINTLCIASKYDGTLPALPELAFCLRLTEEEAQMRLNGLIDARLLDELLHCSRQTVS